MSPRNTRSSLPPVILSGTKGKDSPAQRIDSRCAKRKILSMKEDAAACRRALRAEVLCFAQNDGPLVGSGFRALDLLAHTANTPYTQNLAIWQP